ncbi:cysteine-rich VLP domain-containing protein, partial [Christensenellaceae bacterium OttesenSCG-928-L17]|nr:cysteine-rich VLP domain-containing protein [Christensenellaceae bacterium OttesenSCG-928-L17]
MFNIKNLPDIERKSDDSLLRMTPRQRAQANALIRRECSYYDDGNCLYLDQGEEVVCPQSISYSVCCKFFRHIVLEGKEGKTLKAALF